MNKKGQSLVLFVIILPVILGVLMFIVDLSLANYNTSHLKSVIESNMTVALDKKIKNSDEIKNAIRDNFDNIESVNVIINEDNLEITAKLKEKFLLANVYKMNFYKLDVTYCGNYHNKSIKMSNCNME